MIGALTHTLAFGAIAATLVLAGDLVLPERARRVCLWARWATAFALGVGLIAGAFTLALACGVLSARVIWDVQAAVSVAALVRLVLLVKTGDLSWSAVVRPLSRLSAISRACLALSVVMAAATFVSTLAPPSSMDATVYHLRMPAVYLAQGRWAFLPDIAQTFQPAYVEMAFGHFMALESDVSSALLHWGLGIGAALSAGAWARRFGANPWVAALLVLGTPVFVWESTGAFIDLGLTLFGSLAIYWSSRDDMGRPAVVIAGALAGLAAGSKLTGAALAVLAGAAAFAMAWPRWRLGVGRLLGIGAMALVIALPWYGHNFFTTGNPFYPVGNSVFGVPFRVFDNAHYGYGRSLLNLLLSPFDLVWRGEPFDQGWAVGPAFLALVPLGVFIGRRARIIRLAAACILGFWVFWFYSMPQTRLLLPIEPLGAALAAVAVDWALTVRFRMVRLSVVATTGVSTLMGLAVALAFVRSYLPAALGFESRDAFLTRTSWHYPALAAATAWTPKGARVAVIGADNLYYLRRDAALVKEQTTVAELRKSGFSHLLTIGACNDRHPRMPVLWADEYKLPASRLGGGVAGVLCASLEVL